MKPILNGLPAALPTSKRLTLPINSHDRWFFCGRTGTGKSFLIKHLARIYAGHGGRVVVVDGPDQGWCDKDSTGKRIEPATRGDGTIEQPRLVRHFNKDLRVQMFRPTVPGHRDMGLMHFLQEVFDQEKTLVIFDELFGILDQSHQPEIVMQLWSQGRKHDIACWAASQRPARIPEIVMSQAENWAIFQVLNVEDRRKIAEWTNSPQITDTRLPKRFWWFFNSELDQVQLMAPIKR